MKAVTINDCETQVLEGAPTERELLKEFDRDDYCETCDACPCVCAKGEIDESFGE